MTERVGWNVEMKEGRDVWLHDELRHVDRFCEAEEMDSGTRSSSSTPAEAPANRKA